MASIFENNIVILHDNKPVFAHSAEWLDHFWDMQTLDQGLAFLFAVFNGMMPGEELLSQWYYESAKRSLSVGDVVVINGAAYKCEPIGWTPFDLSTVKE
jgi:hypothetical protein